MLRIFSLLILVAAAASAQTVTLSDAQAHAIGRRIWQNECAGTVSGLTSWNAGEDFASLGIGHFIWYPKGARGPFEESFPKLAAWLAAQGRSVPAWMRGACPWPTRAAFRADADSARMRELRGLLAETVALQARFCALRMEAALPKMLAAAPKGERERIRANFYRVAGQRLGMYALIDYVNFKGEGTNPSERYKGEGWGLLQVLETMGDGPALPAFARAADAMLTRRVKNSPPARHEAKWLPGWRNRVATYAGG
jgi:hypothetical protein